MILPLVLCAEYELTIYSISDNVLQDSYDEVFEPFYLNRGPQLADHIWTLTVRIFDIRWSTTVVQLLAKIGWLFYVFYIFNRALLICACVILYRLI